MERIITIRPARDSDADEIAKLVQKTIRISNAQDYSGAIIKRVVANFSTEAVRDLMRSRIVLAATQDEVIVGTASLDGDVVRTVFVAPEMQNLGVGRRLMDAIEAIATGEGTAMLQVPASLTGKLFYTRLGYSEVRDVFDGDERTVIMAKRIG